MNSIYLHSKKTKIEKYYIYLLILFVLYSIYKNSILVYLGTKLVTFSIFKSILFPIISIGISYLCQKFLLKEKSEDHFLFYTLMLNMTMPVQMSIIIFLIVNIIINLLTVFVFKNTKFNYYCLYKVLIVGLLILLKQNTYANDLELIGKYSYNLIDVFFGRGISGIAISSMFFIIISFLILNSNFYYKNDIPIISLIVYLIGTFILKIAFGKIIILNSMILFAFVFFTTFNEYSPVEKKHRIIYSILIAVLTLVFTYLIDTHDGVFLAIFIASLLNYLWL